MKAKRAKVKTYEHHGIKIRELRPELPEGGGGYYQTDLMRRGRRERTGFDTLEKAKAHCQMIGFKLDNEGAAVLSLTPAQRQDAVAALDIMDGMASLTAAAKLWARHNGIAGGVTVAELGRRWLAALKVQGCRPSTLREREHKVGRLAADMGERPVVSLTRDDIAGWLTAKGGTGATWDGYRRAFNAMFNHAVRERMAESNPVAGIRAVRMDEKLPTPFTVAAVQSLMRTAAEWTPAIVPTLAVQFFAGLRPGEAMGLDWSAVDFKAKTIRVMPETSKVRRTRIVPMNQTLIDWLTPYRKARGKVGIQTQNQFDYAIYRKPIGPATEQKGVPIAERKPDTRPKGLLAAAGVDWIQDGPRKTFATMHFALGGDAGKTAAILGHSGDAGILYKHYRGLVIKADARRFFAIRPATDKVVKVNFKRATA
ncbi:MAG: tyrosine-type recombinase/integrase [Kiritimatiellae bacterium]|nr:tyrosine-type recombinase/integrase [Kiritimatiellia bacterium]